MHRRPWMIRSAPLLMIALVSGYVWSFAGISPAAAQAGVGVTYFDEPLTLILGRRSLLWPGVAPSGYRCRLASLYLRPVGLYSEYGWIWASEEPWGWVVYHYGRWVWSSRYGWVWVAGDEWGPAWVDWCYGGGYVGWAPMPPDPYWQGAYYYGSYDCGSSQYYSRAVFVSETNFASPRVSAYLVASSQNPVVARGTLNVTSYNRVGGSIVNRSIDVAKLQAATGAAIRPVPVIQSTGPIAPGTAPAVLRE